MPPKAHCYHSHNVSHSFMQQSPSSLQTITTCWFKHMKNTGAWKSSKKINSIVTAPSSDPNVGLIWSTAAYDGPFSSPIGLQWPSEKSSHSAAGNGELPSLTILDVIQWAAVGTAITLALMPAHCPVALWFVLLATLFTVETSSDTDSPD